MPEGFLGKSLEQRVFDLIKSVNGGVRASITTANEKLDAFMDNVKTMIGERSRYTRFVYGENKFDQAFCDSLKEGDVVLIKVSTTLKEPLKIGASRIVLEFIPTARTTGHQDFQADHLIDLTGTNNMVTGGIFEKLGAKPTKVISGGDGNVTRLCRVKQGLDLGGGRDQTSIIED